MDSDWKKRKLNNDSVPMFNNNGDDDDDDMFGDDIPVEELEQLEAMNIDEVERKNSNNSNSNSNNNSNIIEIADSLSMSEGPDFKLLTSNSQQGNLKEQRPATKDGQVPQVEAEEDEFGAEFDDLYEQEIPLDHWIQFADICSLPPETPARKKYTRYVVINVAYKQYTIEEANYREKVLLLMEPETDTSIYAHLRGDWYHSIVSSGDIVHIPSIDLTSSTQSNKIVIDNDHHFIIINPDKLISCTSIADTHACLRKAMLQMKIKQVGDYSEALVHGNIIHAVLQNTLQTGAFDVEAIQEQIKVQVLNSLESLYAIDKDEVEVMQSLFPVAEHISYFGRTFLRTEPLPNATPSNDMGVDVKEAMNCQTLSINHVMDIEEHLWSPTYGIKGMIDASVQIKIAPANRVIAVPFELKTGKSSKFLTHRAQTLLYTLLMSDRYDVDVEAGILYYSKDNAFYLIPSIHREVRSLIISRNDLAIALTKQNVLPPMIRNLHQCQYCFVNTACVAYHKSKENGTAITSGLYNLFDEKTKHMTDKTITFFKHWWDLLDLEEVDYDYARREIWSQPADWREMSGRCLSNMVLKIDQCVIDHLTPVWLYCFVRRKGDKTPELTSYLTPGDSVVVSSMDGHINLAMGFVHASTKDSITLNLSEPLRNPPRRGDYFDEHSNQTFQGFLQFGADPKNFYTQRQTTYRIDKDELSSGMALLRNNVVELIANDDSSRPSIGRLRELIVELEPPRFSPPALKHGVPVVPNLNPDQQKALEKVLHTQDYCLILGMPGTGKTTTITEIIKVLLNRGNTILVTAHTHTALDNVLLKLRKSGVDLMRLGPSSKVMPDLKDCVPKFDSSVSSVESLRKQLGSKKLIGVTCLGISHVMLQKKQFDYCIVDEASQITLPTCIGPLRYASKFILVGDQYQLPPIVRDENARRGGLEESLFALLAEAHPDAVTFLQYQYRMNRDIMELPNTLIYGNRLRCGTPAIANRQMDVPQFHDGIKHIHETSDCSEKTDCWLTKVLDPKRKVLFINTDPIMAIEELPEEGSLRNDKEALLIADSIQAFLHCGVAPEKLAIVSFYRSQLRYISQLLKSNAKGVELSTVDRYQGRDKECVLISLVRNNSQGNAGELLRDWRRLNVAFTRAKCKLIIVGSASTLKLNVLYRSLLEILEKKDSVCEATENALRHTFDPTTFESESKKKEHKVFSAQAATLKKNRILKDLFESM